MKATSIISERIRLARNLEGYPFPARMSYQESEEVVERVWSIIQDSEIGGGFTLNKINDADMNERLSLVEAHLISPEIAANERRLCAAAAISKNGEISIMINEEDHIRIQVIKRDEDLEELLKLAQEIDKMLEPLGYALDSEYGYLTACPTNVGTGMRVSVMMHLPALVMTKQMSGIVESCNRLNIEVRGLYGEHSNPEGNMFQISNRVTLGQTEEEFMLLVGRISEQLDKREEDIRGQLYKQDRIAFEDKVARSYGIFANARVMSGKEAVKLMSDIRMGIDLGFIDLPMSVIDEIMQLVQTATIQKYAGREMSVQEREVVRADVIRDKLRLATNKKEG